LPIFKIILKALASIIPLDIYLNNANKEVVYLIKKEAKTLRKQYRDFAMHFKNNKDKALHPKNGPKKGFAYQECIFKE
jgi:hypothetical protein